MSSFRGLRDVIETTGLFRALSIRIVDRTTGTPTRPEGR